MHFPDKRRGQYMVEFAMTFIFFIGVTLAVINMILMAYNFNLFQRVSWEVARKASLGAENGILAQIIYDDLITKLFASPFLVSAVEFDRTTFIVPNNLSERTEGTRVDINLAYRSGFAFLQGAGIYARFPVKTSLIVIARNDADRDGFYDTTFAGALNDSRQLDHDNDGLPDATDVNDDWRVAGAAAADDGGNFRPDTSDRGFVKYNATTQRYEMDTGLGFGFATRINRDSGLFFCRVNDFSVFGVSSPGPYPIAPRKVPRNYSDTGANPIITSLDLSYDNNNNGWDDWVE